MSAAVEQGRRGWVQPLSLPVTSAPLVSLRDRLSWIRLESRRAPLILAGALIALGLVTGLFRVIDAQGPWAFWLGLALLAWTLQAVLWRWWACDPEAPAATLLRWDAANTSLMLGQGLLTGLMCGLLAPEADAAEQAVLLTVVFICVIGAVPSLAARGGLFHWYALVTAGPMALTVLLGPAGPSR